jgi:hypothetical protein
LSTGRLREADGVLPVKPPVMVLGCRHRVSTPHRRLSVTAGPTLTRDDTDTGTDTRTDTSEDCMSHGNVATHIGTCTCCGRENVDLYLAPNEDRKTGERKFVCTDSFGCFAAWQARQGER